LTSITTRIGSPARNCCFSVRTCTSTCAQAGPADREGERFSHLWFGHRTPEVGRLLDAHASIGSTRTERRPGM
jgi:hypothetical protein